MKLVETTDLKTLELTDAAAEAVKHLLVERNLEGYALRVYVQGSGCSGYQYGMALEGKIREQDTVIEEHGIKVVVDEVSINYMRGSSIDYVNDTMGSGFKIDNPNALSSCGCSSSSQAEQGSGNPKSCSGCG